MNATIAMEHVFYAFQYFPPTINKVMSFWYPHGLSFIRRTSALFSPIWTVITIFALNIAVSLIFIINSFELILNFFFCSKTTKNDVQLFHTLP